MAKARQKAIQRQLPDVIDLLTISVEAGLGVRRGAVPGREERPGPARRGDRAPLQEMQIGVTRDPTPSGTWVSGRTSEELKAFVLSMIQADLFGV